MRNKKKNRILLLVILLLAVSIGYAALSTTLKINGTAGINKNTWNIYWDNIANEKGVTPDEETAIGPNSGENAKSIVTFDVTFDKPGDFYEFEVDAVNAGTIDASITSIVKKYNDTVVPEVEDDNNRVVPKYIKYEVKYADGTKIQEGDKLPKAVDLESNPQVLTKKTYKIRVEYDKDNVTNADVNNQSGKVTHEFSFEVKYGQYIVPSPVSFSTDSWDTITEAGSVAAKQTSVANNKCGAYTLGDTKVVKMDMNNDGIDEDYTVRIANCSTPVVCSDSSFSQTACGFVVEFTEAIMKQKYNEASESVATGGYPASDLYNNYLKDNSQNWIYNKLPSSLKDNIIATKAISGFEGSTGTNYVSTDKMYLLSEHEVIANSDSEYGTYTYDNAYDSTRQLDYYHAQGVDKTNYTGNTKKYGNTNVEWWLRGANKDTDAQFTSIPDSGGWGAGPSTLLNGVSPAFRLGK